MEREDLQSLYGSPGSDFERKSFHWLDATGKINLFEVVLSFEWWFALALAHTRNICR